LLCATAQATPFRGRGFMLDVPRGWKTQLLEAAEVLLLGPGNGANFNVVTSPARPGQTLEAGAKEINAELRKLKGYKRYGQKVTQLNGVRAFADEYAYDSPHNGRLRVRQVMAIRGGKVYAVTAMSRTTTWPRVWPAFKATFASFRWTK
jgi:hypothetical protein